MARSSKIEPVFEGQLVFDPSLGAYRNLATGIIYYPGGQVNPNASAPEASPRRVRGRRLRRALVGAPEPTEPEQIEWYAKRVGRWTRTVTKTSKDGRKQRTDSIEAHATAGMVIGVGALVLGFETGQAIAHGLAGLDPMSWSADIEGWMAHVTGDTSSGAVTPVPPPTVGAALEAHLMYALVGPSAPASSSSSGGSSSGSSGGSSGGSHGAFGNGPWWSWIL